MNETCFNDSKQLKDQLCNLVANTRLLEEWKLLLVRDQGCFRRLNHPVFCTRFDDVATPDDGRSHI